MLFRNVGIYKSTRRYNPVYAHSPNKPEHDVSARYQLKTSVYMSIQLMHSNEALQRPTVSFKTRRTSHHVTCLHNSRIRF
jgi:hypothetical protein